MFFISSRLGIDVYLCLRIGGSRSGPREIRIWDRWSRFGAARRPGTPQFTQGRDGNMVIEESKAEGGHAPSSTVRARLSSRIWSWCRRVSTALRRSHASASAWSPLRPAQMGAQAERHVGAQAERRRVGAQGWWYYTVCWVACAVGCGEGARELLHGEE